MDSDSKSFQYYRDFAVSVAREAGTLLMRNYGKMQTLEWKLRTNFKTQVDDESDKLINDRIKNAFPKHSIYSEELSDREKGSEYKWVVDPLDGTIPYTYGFCDHFSVCLSLVKGRTPIVGVIYAPLRDELYTAVEGKGAFLNNERIKVSLEESLNHAVLSCGPGKEIPQFKRVDQIEYEKKLYSENGAVIAINTGCASVPLAFVARGLIHGCVYPNLEPWDMAAGVVINREAETKVTNIKGEDWKLGDSSLIVANPALHKKIMDLLNRN